MGAGRPGPTTRRQTARHIWGVFMMLSQVEPCTQAPKTAQYVPRETSTPWRYIIVVQLSSQAVEAAMAAARQRLRELLRDHVIPRPVSEQVAANHRIGALGELAASQGLGLAWTGLSMRGAVDVWPFEIKASQFYSDNGHLDIPAGYPDYMPVICAAPLEAPHYWALWGWRYAGHVYRHGKPYKQHGRDKYIIKYVELDCMTTLPIRLPREPDYIPINQAAAALARFKKSAL
jgi:hypothetical protein